MKPLGLGVSLTVVIAVLLAVAMFVMPGWEHPPMHTEQIGHRGLGMEQIDSPRALEMRAAANQVPAAIPPAPPGSPPATSVYKNVQVLNDLSVAEFTRLMVAMTSWVSPQQGCNYCHNPADLAADIPEKVIARQMLRMTRHINADWKSHVGDTGVTCYTCHRGNPVPAHIWFTDPGQSGKRFAGNRAGQNTPSSNVGFASLPYDPFTRYLERKDEVRVVSAAALPTGTNPAGIKEAEATYGLMMHISKSLGVNCTFCHNSRSFFDWEASTPHRVNAWYGIRMARDLNVAYMEPLAGKYPQGRTGPAGDVPKLNCATCHQGVFRPLNGVSMLSDYRALAGAAKPAAAATSSPVTTVPAAAADPMPATEAPAATAPATR